MTDVPEPEAPDTELIDQVDRPKSAAQLLAEVGTGISFAGPWVRVAVAQAVQMEQLAIRLEAVTPSDRKAAVAQELTRRERLYMSNGLASGEARDAALESVYDDVCAGRFG